MAGDVWQELREERERLRVATAESRRSRGENPGRADLRLVVSDDLPTDPPPLPATLDGLRELGLELEAQLLGIERPPTLRGLDGGDAA